MSLYENDRDVDTESMEYLWATHGAILDVNSRGLRKLKRNPRIKEILTDQIISMYEPMEASNENIPYDESKLTYGLQMIGANRAQEMGFDGSDVVVGVIDSGIDEVQACL